MSIDVIVFLLISFNLLDLLLFSTSPVFTGFFSDLRERKREREGRREEKGIREEDEGGRSEGGGERNERRRGRG